MIFLPIASIMLFSIGSSALYAGEPSKIQENPEKLNIENLRIIETLTKEQKKEKRRRKRALKEAEEQKRKVTLQEVIATDPKERECIESAQKTINELVYQQESAKEQLESLETENNPANAEIIDKLQKSIHAIDELLSTNNPITQDAAQAASLLNGLTSLLASVPSLSSLFAFFSWK